MQIINETMKALNILFRILGVIPFAVLSLIGAFILWLKWNFNFIRFGGEAISYTTKTERKTIRDVYNLIEKDLIKK